MSAINFVVGNTIFSWASAKLFDIVDPKTARIAGASFSIIVCVASAALKKVAESVKEHVVTQNQKFVAVVIVFSAVYTAGIVGAKAVVKNSGREISYSQINRLNIINFSVFFLFLNIFGKLSNR